MKNEGWRIKGKRYEIIRIKDKGECVKDKGERRMEKEGNKDKGWDECSKYEIEWVFK